MTENEIELTCERCEEKTGELFPVNTSRREMEEWCETCRDNHAFTCEGCDAVFSTDDCYSNPNTGDGCYCESCCPNEEHGIIRDYGDDVDTTPIGTPPHFYGVELEVECGCDCEKKAERVQSLLGDFAIIKEDGSIDAGFEIVTRPASLAKQIELWQPFFERGTKGLSSFNTKTCGLHVHCSRRPLTQLQIAKVVCFVNAAHNRKFMSALANRTSSRWAAYHAKRLAEGNKTNPERYEAVNLQNRNTIEFRIFKGTLKKESVFKAIEFCDALIHFCEPASRSLRDTMSRVKFLEYVFGNRKQWPHLAAWIESRWQGRVTQAGSEMGFRVGTNMETPETNQTEE